MIEIDPVDLSSDERGHSFEIPEELSRLYPRAHVVVNFPGCVRGNHVHSNADEVLIVQGPALVSWRDETGDLGQRAVDDSTVVRFSFPAGVVHAVRNEGAEVAVLLSLQRSVDGAPIRTERDPILPNVP